jgi:hypothetical protein
MPCGEVSPRVPRIIPGEVLIKLTPVVMPSRYPFYMRAANQASNYIAV